MHESDYAYFVYPVDRQPDHRRKKLNDAVRGILHQQLGRVSRNKEKSSSNHDLSLADVSKSQPQPQAEQGNKTKHLSFKTPLVSSRKELPLNQVAGYDAPTGRYLHPITSTPAERVKMKKLLPSSG